MMPKAKLSCAAADYAAYLGARVHRLIQMVQGAGRVWPGMEGLWDALRLLGQPPCPAGTTNRLDAEGGHGTVLHGWGVQTR
ncbi:MAG: hypothetical protein JO266_08225 [Acidobacteria bacterium]|nr:hypothetical protein [Acidobacteriota bacterium]